MDTVQGIRRQIPSRCDNKARTGPTPIRKPNHSGQTNQLHQRQRPKHPSRPILHRSPIRHVAHSILRPPTLFPSHVFSRRSHPNLNNEPSLQKKPSTVHFS